MRCNAVTKGEKTLKIMHKHNAGGQRLQLNGAHALRESEGNLRDIPQSVSLAAMSLQQTENFK